MEEAMKFEEPAGAASGLSDVLERRVAELAEWFSDNPNTADIKDGIRCLVRDAIFAERIACAMVCENLTIVPEMQGYTSTLCAAEIRMRSNAEFSGRPKAGPLE